VARVFELVDIGPDLGLPAFFVSGRFTAGGTSGVQRDGWRFYAYRYGAGQFDENAANFFNLLVRSEEMLVSQQVSETELSSFRLSFGARMKRAIFGT